MDLIPIKDVYRDTTVLNLNFDSSKVNFIAILIFVYLFYLYIFRQESKFCVGFTQMA